MGLVQSFSNSPKILNKNEDFPKLRIVKESKGGYAFSYSL